MGNFVRAQRTINAQLSQKIDTMENNVNKRIDGLQSEMEQKLDNLQYSISKLANQLVYQEEENLEGEWLTDQEELMQEPVEAPEELPTGEAGGGRGKEAGEEPQESILQPIPMNLNPTATTQATKSPLPVYILPTPAANPKPAAQAPTTKATHHCLCCKTLENQWPLFEPLPLHQRHKQLLTSQGIVDGSGAGSDLEHPNPDISELRQFQQPPKA